MPLIKLQNYISDDPAQEATINRIASFTDFWSHHTNFMSVNHSNNTVVIPKGSVLVFNKTGLTEMFVADGEDLLLSTASLDVGQSFIAGKSYYIYLINESDRGLLKISLNEEVPEGYSEANSLCIGQFLTAKTAEPGYAPGDIYTDSIADYRLLRALDGSHPVGSMMVQYPGQQSPGVLYARGLFADISFAYGNGFFRVEGDVAKAFEDGLQEASAPNITATWRLDGYVTSSPTGKLSGAVAPNGVGDASNRWQTGSANWTPVSFDASRSSSDYGRRGNDLAPGNQSIKIWRRVGIVIKAQDKNYYRYDESGAYLTTHLLQADRAGYIGFNPNNMTDVEPPAAQVGKVAIFNRQNGGWALKANTLGLTAYNTKNALGRPLFDYDQPSDDETLKSPEGIASPKWDNERGEWVTDGEADGIIY